MHMAVRRDRKLKGMKRITALAALPILALGLAACDDDKGTVTPAQSEAAAVAEAETDTEVATEEEGAADSAADEVTTTNPTFGDTYTWPDGLAVTISEPADFTPTENAAGQVEGQANLAYDITVTNGTSEDIDAAMITLTVSSGGQQSGPIFDTEGGTEMPTATILPGKSLTWKVVYSVADPSDVQITVDNVIDFDSDKVHFTN